MKLAIWMGFAFLVFLWTGTIWIAVELTGWVGSVLSSGSTVEWSDIATRIDLPAWLTWWIDPAAIEAVMNAVVRTMQAVSETLPWLDSVVGWVVVALWVTWGLGTLALLLLAGGFHWLASRSTPRPSASA